jgi:hypothetical protein
MVAFLHQRSRRYSIAGIGCCARSTSTPSRRYAAEQRDELAPSASVSAAISPMLSAGRGRSTPLC